MTPWLSSCVCGEQFLTVLLFLIIEKKVEYEEEYLRDKFPVRQSVHMLVVMEEKHTRPIIFRGHDCMNGSQLDP